MAPKRARALSVSLADVEADRLLVDHVLVADVVAEDRMARLWPYAAPSLKHAPNWGDIHKNRALLNDAIVLTKGRLLNFMRFEIQLKKFFDDIAPNTFSVKDITTIATYPQ